MQVTVIGAGTLVEGQGAGQQLDVFIAGDDEEAKEMVAQLVRDGGLRAINVGPLERARQLEGLGFLGTTLQQPLGLNFQSAWKLISEVLLEYLQDLQEDQHKPALWKRPYLRGF
jgi:hypothetical protein